MKIAIADIMSVYSGKEGCACGCRGKHTYAKAFQAEGTKRRGYKVEDKDCNDRTVAKHVKTIEQHADIAEVTAKYVSVLVGERRYIAYFKEGK